MRYPKEHKAQIRRQILGAAARLFREHGYDGVGVDAIMAEAGLTAGGFYAHFPSKEALFAEAVTFTLEQSAARRHLEGRSGEHLGQRAGQKAGGRVGQKVGQKVGQRVTRTGRPGPLASGPLLGLINGYLSRAHRDAVAKGCPLPALTPDVARSGPATRECYERELCRLLVEIERWLPDGSTPQRNRAWALIAECVGGLMLSRAVKDEKLSDQILRACRQAAAKICEP